MLQISPIWVLATLFFYLLYWGTRKRVVVNNWLLFLFGILVYSWGNVFQGALLVGLTVANYLLVHYVFPKKKFLRVGFVSGLLLNIGIWLCTKYYFAGKAGGFGVAVPLGISFYTLRMISFLVAEFKHKTEIPVRFVEYGLYIAFFPQIISGPIERPEKFLRQIKFVREIDFEYVVKSLEWIILGLLKKLIIADNIRIIVDRIFHLNSPPYLLVLVGTAGFAVQLFCDFSGYTDISRGLAGLLGFETSINFARPFSALTPGEFWNRWHITFSDWLQAFVFSPLRRIFIRKHRVLALIIPPVVTMILSGFWHGNGWNFILWGFYHGVLIVIYQAFQIDFLIKEANWLQKFITWLITSNFILFGWLLFRSPDLVWLYQVTKAGNFGLSGDSLAVSLSFLFLICMYSIPLLIHRLLPTTGKFGRFSMPTFYAVAVILLLIFGMSGFQEFIYFDF